MINAETAHYIKGMHNLLNAHFILKNNEKFALTLNDFKEFAKTEIANQHDNNRNESRKKVNISCSITVKFSIFAINLYTDFTRYSINSKLPSS